MNFNVKQKFFKKLSSKVWRFSMYIKHKYLIFAVEKNCTVKNYMSKIDIKSTITICPKLTVKTPRLFFYCWLWTCTCLLSSYLHFYCLGDLHYRNHFHCLHDLQKNWNLVYILKLVSWWFTYQFSYATGHNDARRCWATTNDVLKLLFMYYNLPLLYLFCTMEKSHLSIKKVVKGLRN